MFCGRIYEIFVISNKCRDGGKTFRWKLATDPSSDPAYILQLPMAKAAVKALDTVENFLTSTTAPEEVKALRFHGGDVCDTIFRSRLCASLQPTT